MEEARDLDSLLTTARGFWKRGDFRTSLDQLHNALQLDPTNAEALFGLAMLRAARREYAAAVAAMERAIEAEPETPALYLALGTIYAESGRRSEARRAFRRVLRMGDP